MAENSLYQDEPTADDTEMVGVNFAVDNSATAEDLLGSAGSGESQELAKSSENEGEEYQGEMCVEYYIVLFSAFAQPPISEEILSQTSVFYESAIDSYRNRQLQLPDKAALIPYILVYHHCTLF